MNLKRVFTTVILIVIFIEAINAQSNNNKRKKKKKKKKVDFKNRLYCFTCLADYSVKKVDIGDPCINPLFNATDSQQRYLTMCPREAKMCQVEITTINKVFSGIERRCSTNCYPTCFTRGYGLEYEACTHCCSGIDPEDFDQDTAYDYRCPSFNLENINTNITVTVRQYLQCVLELESLLILHKLDLQQERHN
ncbi:hypothetical protein B4U80_08672 [Leptotrombidium deliense]|uniref:Uncharacterized protein n=1 Tax=Leptotrombidium deliense TaxID=299467 RepID=A0A443SIN6_9ACAR|nr:hypothetical protein B4U80_08672 [Leptotrombidium deliense]